MSLVVHDAAAEKASLTDSASGLPFLRILSTIFSFFSDFSYPCRLEMLCPKIQ